MGFLKNIFNSLATGIESSTDQAQDVHDPQHIQYEGLDFFCELDVSQNGRWTLAWSDSHPRIGGGHRTKGLGAYFLLDDNLLVVAGRLERPNHGKVSNSGILIINDWLFTDQLRGRFYAYTHTGEEIITEELAANLFNNGISESGRLAVCQTCNSDSSDGNKLVVFDLQAAEIASRICPDNGWAEDYEFDEDRSLIHLLYEGDRSYAYSVDGRFVDRERWEIERIEYASGYELVSIAEERVKRFDEPSKGELDETIQLLEKALQSDISENYQAMAHRLLGELWAKMDEISKAINELERAIEINPKVGAKRLLGKLKQSSGS